MSTCATSKTPILDLLEPLPKPFDEGINGRFTAPFLTAVGCIVIGQNYSLLAIVLGALLIGFLTTFIHEIGHLCAGWAVGFRFEGVTIGPFVLKRMRTGLNFRIRPRLRGGFAYMSPDKICRLRKRSIVLCLGGPLASLVVGAAVIVGGETARAYYDSSWPTFLDFLGFYSVVIGLYSFSSYRSGAYAGDGMLLRGLIKSREEARQLIAASALSVLANKNPDGVRWNSRWQRVALLDSRFTTPFHRAWQAYSAATGENSATLLEQCLATSWLVEREHRPHLIAEVIKFTAWDLHDPEKAQRWLKLLGSEERLDLLTRARMKVALHASLRDFDRSLQEWQTGLALIQKSPRSVAASECEAAWHAWRREIEKRAARAPLAEPTPVGA